MAARNLSPDAGLVESEAIQAQICERVTMSPRLCGEIVMRHASGGPGGCRRSAGPRFVGRNPIVNSVRQGPRTFMNDEALMANLLPAPSALPATTRGQKTRI